MIAITSFFPSHPLAHLTLFYAVALVPPSFHHFAIALKVLTAEIIVPSADINNIAVIGTARELIIVELALTAIQTYVRIAIKTVTKAILPIYPDCRLFLFPADQICVDVLHTA